ncbi:L-threonylcarbamoyladenylate synthase [Staphylococcus sp. SQ8-PEA]|uniref:Threonylcarbamoyl-AMP synthase n=1 Tax=Staphylococcus marylandisciuri TaxID=2981529 RepID=A0ABT2QRG7_9STAP|nr:L-threonylcarbamoyladenylate synthase [Staphylococcus marylandisciuri]MCU5746581.1 L-threonylcarbamoyladenylate synthase [Staphylococcus marylandisciuri]
MDTRIWDMREQIAPQELEEIKSILQEDGLIVIPTETVYGLGGNALSDVATQKIYEAKGRPSDNPLIVHIHNTKQLKDIVSNLPEKVERLMEAFWPGPISFILPLQKGYLCERVSGGLDSIAVRMPSHNVGRRILEHVDLPIAAPSANLSGRPSPTQFEHAYEDLNGRVEGIVNGDRSEEGLESTVLDCTSFPYYIARPGAITRTMIEAIIPNSIRGESQMKNGQPIAPGMKYKHYAPDTPVTVITQLNRKVKDAEKWSDVVFAVPDSLRDYLPESSHFISLCEDETDIKTANQRLYQILHHLDTNDNYYRAYVYGFDKEIAAEAFMNRLLKAANYDIVTGDHL